MSIDDGDGLRGRATNSIGWIVAERWSSRIISLAVFAILARLLTPDAFGVIALATSFLAILQVFVDSGFSKALIQRRELQAKDASTAFWTSLAMAVVLYAAVFFLANPVSTLLGQPDLALVLQVMALGLPITALSRTPAALLERDFGFKTLSIRQLIGALSGAVVAVPMAFLGFGVWALVAQTLVTAVASVITLWSTTDWRPRLEYSVESFRGLWAVGSGILGVELLDAVQGNIDKLVIGLFFSADELGFYYLAQRVGTILIELVTSVISRVSLTTFSKVQDDRPRLNRIFQQLTFAAAAASVPIFGLVAILAPQIIPFVFGDGWGASIPLLWVLAPGWALGAVMYFDRSVLLATAHSRAAFLLALLQNAVGVLLVFLLLPLGVFGVALSRWSRVVTWPVRLTLLRNLVGIQPGKTLSQVARCLLSIAPALVLIGWLQTTPWATVDHAFWTFAVPLGAVGLASYAGVLWLVCGPENRGVLKFVLQGITRRLRRR